MPASSTSFGSDDLTVCPFALPNEPYSLSPGSTFTATIPVTAGATTTPSAITVSSFGHGATTDAWSTPINSSLSVVATAAAGAGFSSVTGPGGTLTSVQTGNEPQVTGNYLPTGTPTYNTYTYKIKNTGSVAITSATIGIPSQDTTGSNGADSSGTIWKLTAAPTLVNEATGNANGCTDTYVNPTSGTEAAGTAQISITCPSGDFIAGQTLDVTFNANTPLKINSTYAWPATVNGSATAVSANWTDDEDILIALSANVTVNVNPSAASSCTGTGSGFAITLATETVNFGQIATGGTATCPDAMIAQVTTDASDPTNWSFYASASGNPPTTGASVSNELLISTDPANSTGGTTNVPSANIPCPSGSGDTTCFSYDSTSYTVMAVTGSGNGNRLGYTTNGGTGINNNTVTFDIDYRVTLGTETPPQTGNQETITYTWIAN